MSLLWVFLWVVIEHWVVLVTGGIVTAGLTALQLWRGKPFSWRFQKWVIVMFIAIACFLAWRDEYERAQQLLVAKADLEGRLQEREHRIDELRSYRGSEEDRRAIERLHVTNAQIEAELHSSQQALSALQDSLKSRRLSADERRRLIDVLSLHDGKTFSEIRVAAFPSCHECMTYAFDIAHAINSVQNWTARAHANFLISVDFSGIGIGMQDPGSPPAVIHVLADALKAAGLPYTIETLDFLSPDMCMVVVGNKP